LSANPAAGAPGAAAHGEGLTDAGDEIYGDADVERAVAPIGHDVDGDERAVRQE
jgi:hypothetical protein